MFYHSDAISVLVERQMTGVTAISLKADDILCENIGGSLWVDVGNGPNSPPVAEAEMLVLLSMLLLSLTSPLGKKMNARRGAGRLNLPGSRRRVCFVRDEFLLDPYPK